MFTPNVLYKHKNNTDIAFEVVKSYYVPAKHSDNPRWKLKVLWWRVWSGGVKYPMLITQRIEIPKAALRDWEPYWDLLRGRRF